jgi:hypothetical protein
MELGFLTVHWRACCEIGGNRGGYSANVKKSTLCPYLEMLLFTQKSEARSFREVAPEFLGKLDQLRILSLCMSDFYFN